MPNPLRLLSWNLLEGGYVPKHQNPGLPKMDEMRLAAARALVTELAPDVLVLNEALWCRPVDGYQVDYAGLFGFEHACGGLYDGVWGNMILSRLPVLSCHHFSIYNRGGVMALVQADGWTLQVGTYHPHPSRYPHHKAQDYLALAAQADAALPLALCGDFNAISPEDAPDREALALAFGRFSKQPEQDSARFIDGGTEVFEALGKAGLRDAVPPCGRRASMPTRLITDVQDSGMRIDHIWVNQAVKVCEGEVVQAPLADAASDHYPVRVDLLPA